MKKESEHVINFCVNILYSASTISYIYGHVLSLQNDHQSKPPTFRIISFLQLLLLKISPQEQMIHL